MDNASKAAEIQAALEEACDWAIAQGRQIRGTMFIVGNTACCPVGAYYLMHSNFSDNYYSPLARDFHVESKLLKYITDGFDGLSEYIPEDEESLDYALYQVGANLRRKYIEEASSG